MARRGILLWSVTCLALWNVCFVNLPRSQREPLVLRGDKETRARGNARRGHFQRQNVRMVEIEGKMMPQQFLTALAPEESDTPWSVRQAPGGELSVTFTKKPYGIVRWQPGQDFKGAMVKAVAKPVYINDPLGQAETAGIKPGMVVKKINGADVMSEDFDVIMKKLGDDALGFSQFVQLPDLGAELRAGELRAAIENNLSVIVRALSSASMAKPPEKDEKIARIQGDGDNADADVDGADVPSDEPEPDRTPTVGRRPSGGEELVDSYFPGTPSMRHKTERSDRFSVLSVQYSLNFESHAMRDALPPLLVVFAVCIAALLGLVVAGLHDMIKYVGCPLGINGCNSIWKAPPASQNSESIDSAPSPSFSGYEDKGYFLVRALEKYVPEDVVHVGMAAWQEGWQSS
ncbi:unnamed protein product [Durusdinium trenchii]|uniref:PDZ domain-containing protein n=1 Tax=Durusdinium trenchii TaxID=1381693 RepID=A0ABP0J9T0_9DINO